MNNQPIEKAVRGDGLELDVVEVFPTIQGEGPFAGQRAVFVRLAGCNLQCPACDTDYTSGRERMSLETLMKLVSCYEHRLLVITGGEPFRQNLVPFVRELLRRDFRVQIETNGTLSPGNKFPWGEVTIVVSPKTGKVHEDIARNATAYKYVLDARSQDPDDGLPVLALGHPARPRVARPVAKHRPVGVYLQPADTKDAEQNQRNLNACVDAVQQHGHILCLQLHKLIGVA